MGIGVRAALYAQIIFAWGMSLKYPETFVKNSRASYMIATGLLVASLIQWKTHDLSILDAVVVSLVTSMMIIFIVVSGTTREAAKSTASQPNQNQSGQDQPSQDQSNQNSAQANTPNANSQAPSTSPPTQTNQPTPPNTQPTTEQPATPESKTLQPRKSITQRFILFCFVNLWGGFCFNLWSDPVHFGLKAEKVKSNCTNDEIAVWLFGVEVQAINPELRIAALVLVSVLYFVALCSIFFTLENVLEPAIKMLRFIGSLFTAESPKSGSATPQPTASRSLHEDPVINRVHYLLHIFAFGTLSYLLVSTEMTIHRNGGTKMVWSYGQVIALILLLQQLMDVCSTIVEAREERELKRLKEEIELKRIQGEIETPGAPNSQAGARA
ncbi:unnamed protein product [Rhizoctonia solani]|uniref:Uncharacterized protein n=1 Tax=Rhizoctonia solani TaxID=456999 RepID=A0A8H3DIT8_9AGAM|nr:unnamed protein product [Rhizoctonia solani]